LRFALGFSTTRLFVARSDFHRRLTRFETIDRNRLLELDPMLFVLHGGLFLFGFVLSVGFGCYDSCGGSFLFGSSCFFFLLLGGERSGSSGINCQIVDIVGPLYQCRWCQLVPENPCVRQ
jgi:hypothetical protein